MGAHSYGATYGILFVTRNFCHHQTNPDSEVSYLRGDTSETVPLASLTLGGLEPSSNSSCHPIKRFFYGNVEITLYLKLYQSRPSGDAE